VFAEWIKKRDKNTCYTCGAKAEGYGCHAGHFIPKAAGGLALYFHPDNVHVQCARCNLFLAGNQYVYGQKLGAEKVAELYKLQNAVVKDYPFEAEIERYTKLLTQNHPEG